MKSSTVRLWLTLCVGGLLAPLAPNLAQAQTRCTDDLNGNRAATSSKAAKGGALAPRPAGEPSQAEPPLDPLSQLQVIAREASRRSHAVGAARLLAEAARADVEEAQAGYWPTVGVSASFGGGSTEVDGRVTSQGKQAAVNLSVSAPVWDNGRVRQMTDYREKLASVARYGAAITSETVVLEAVTAALERNRYRLQAQVYQQYMRKMSCLVEALEGIVAEDRGRASELIQARKTQAQTELQRDQALAQSRQIEIRLRRLIGDNVLPGDGITIPLASVPEIGEINRQIEMSNEARQLRTQAEAMESYTRAVVAGQRPQLNWNLGRSQGTQGGAAVASWQAGVTVSYSLFNGFSDAAAQQAAMKRAEAARRQLDELLTGKFARTAEMYDTASSAFDRARRYVDVLRDSEKVRNFTFQQWSQLGRRSLFDVMSSESDHFNLRIAYVNALHDGYLASAQLRSLGNGLSQWLVPEMVQLTQ